MKDINITISQKLMLAKICDIDYFAVDDLSTFYEEENVTFLVDVRNIEDAINNSGYMLIKSSSLFCSVVTIHDRTTNELLVNMAISNKEYEDHLSACIIFSALKLYELRYSDLEKLLGFELKNISIEELKKAPDIVRNAYIKSMLNIPVVSTDIIEIMKNNPEYLEEKKS